MTDLKLYDGMNAVEKLNFFRNRYYQDGNSTEAGVVANAINDILPDYARNRRAQPENEPLTLEELRDLAESDEYGGHIWVVELEAGDLMAALTDVTGPDGVVAVWNARAEDNYVEKDYGITWLAYRAKPERSDLDA